MYVMTGLLYRFKCYKMTYISDVKTLTGGYFIVFFKSNMEFQMVSVSQQFLFGGFVLLVSNMSVVKLP